MAAEFSILGRGRAGRALAGAWGSAVPLLSREGTPDGFVLLAVPDDAIPAQAARFPGRCAHLSGSLHLEGVPCVHPLTSFDGQAADWRGTPLALTGEVPGFLVEAFQELGFEPFTLDPRFKALYHAAAVLTSAHSASLWLGAAELLRASGIELPGRGLMPLVEATRHNIERHGAAGRTGPFVRGDEETIARDAAALPEVWREIFLKLGHLGCSHERKPE
ncbi:MAG: DUF2520 domain-containing protein [Holophagaceae bacterium]|nr:DUF2520 domain-containing protein [Holophagaceae bacterium]